MKDNTDTITFVQNGFSLVLEEETVAVQWAEIQSIFAYKVDMLTVDSVYLDIFLEDRCIRVNEEMCRWNLFLERLATALPASKKNWLPEVMFPAFETNLRLIYDRQGREEETVIAELYN